MNSCQPLLDHMVKVAALGGFGPWASQFCICIDVCMHISAKSQVMAAFWEICLNGIIINAAAMNDESSSTHREGPVGFHELKIMSTWQEFG